MKYGHEAVGLVLALTIRIASAARIKQKRDAEQGWLTDEDDPTFEGVVECHPKTSWITFGIAAGVVVGCCVTAVLWWYAARADQSGAPLTGRDGMQAPSWGYVSTRVAVPQPQATPWTCGRITWLIAPIIAFTWLGGLLGFAIGSNRTLKVLYNCEEGTKPPEKGNDCNFSPGQCLAISGFCAAIERGADIDPQVDAAGLHERKRVSCKDDSIDNYVTCGLDGSFSPTPQCIHHEQTSSTTTTSSLATTESTSAATTTETTSTTTTTTTFAATESTTASTTTKTTSTTTTATTTTTTTFSLAATEGTSASTTTATTSTTTTTSFATTESTSTTTTRTETSTIDLQAIKELESLEAQKEGKAKFMLIDAKTENFIKLKDEMIRTKEEFPLKSTLVAFDFDLTLRDDDPDDKQNIILRKGESTREFLVWLKEQGVPAIIVTARSPQDFNTWKRTYAQVETLKITEFIGQHIPDGSQPHRELNENVERCKDNANGTQSSCYVIKDITNGVRHKYAEGLGLLIAGHEKAEAITHFIKSHGMSISQVVFADDYATHVTNVARSCGAEDSVRRVVGAWLAPFDRDHDTEEFVDKVYDNTQKLKKCFDKDKYSKCIKEYKPHWCEDTMIGWLGDNSFSPVAPENLYNVEVVRLSHFPTNDEEAKLPKERQEVAVKQAKEIQEMKRLCRDMERKEENDKKQAAEDVARAAGGLPLCDSLRKCTMAKFAGKKATCDVNSPKCRE